ncbi:MAG: Cys-tRNA(Pro) deacylase, partial [Acidobacteriota bacterium]|nr:Cys-tRNA(Pro) deacylase [Acidobacteriota bacterium]
VFKTLVVRGDRNGVCLAAIPGNAEVDLKALARLTGDRKMELAPLREVQSLTGYVRGGVTALACRKDYPVYLDETAILFDAISISAGVRGTQVILGPEDYARVTGAVMGEISKAK